MFFISLRNKQFGILMCKYNPFKFLHLDKIDKSTCLLIPSNSISHKFLHSKISLMSISFLANLIVNSSKLLK